jgi:hypothetical protein
MKPIAFLCALTLLCGCAATPPAPAPDTAQAHQPLNGNAVRSAVAPQNDTDKDLAAWARSQGFRLQRRDDKVFWCRNIAEIGSHLAHNDCVSDSTLVDMRSTYEANKEQLREALQTCTNGGACGSK